MFVREHQNQFRGAQADVQKYFGLPDATARFSWNKPVGTNFIYMLLVSGGGIGNPSVQGGGTGAIGIWFGAAKHIPNALNVSFSTTATQIITNTTSAAQTIFSVSNATSTSGASAPTVDGYWASGYYNFTAGINGSTGQAAPSTTTFLNQGTTTAGATGNYGYTPGNNGGFLLLNPIIVSITSGANSRAGNSTAYGSGASNSSPIATPGFAIIASW